MWGGCVCVCGGGSPCIAQRNLSVPLEPKDGDIQTRGVRSWCRQCNSSGPSVAGQCLGAWNALAGGRGGARLKRSLTEPAQASAGQQGSGADPGRGLGLRPGGHLCARSDPAVCCELRPVQRWTGRRLVKGIGRAAGLRGRMKKNRGGRGRGERVVLERRTERVGLERGAQERGDRTEV